MNRILLFDNVDSTLAKHSTNTPGPVYDILMTWSNRQSSREEAFIKLGEALIHPDVGLNLIAREFLNYPYQENSVLAGESISSLNFRKNTNPSQVSENMSNVYLLSDRTEIDGPHARSVIYWAQQNRGRPAWEDIGHITNLKWFLPLSKWRLHFERGRNFNIMFVICWLKRQNSRQEAYNLMGQALVHPDVGLKLLATEILDYQSGAQTSSVYKGNKELQNYHIKNLSQRLHKDDMYRLAPKLNISIVTVDSTFAKYCTNTNEAIKEILHSWLKRQTSREDAYVKLGEALIHPDVGLNLVAREILDYPPANKTFSDSQHPNKVTTNSNNERRQFY